MTTDTLARPTTCIWCRQRVTDGRVESGFTGEGPDWAADGDYGCDASPGTNYDGCYGHIGRSSLRALLATRYDPIEVKALMARLER